MQGDVKEKSTRCAAHVTKKKRHFADFALNSAIAELQKTGGSDKQLKGQTTEAQQCVCGQEKVVSLSEWLNSLGLIFQP